ncbi:hypothetical protein JAO29_23080 [Edaphobacter sp. HDX4]|uniref:DUF5666 domain-containing protein n=1 Tax=Edaphobacter sp. HDX4 TaxID=2794064 RepID=UPI002FE62C32
MVRPLVSLAFLSAFITDSAVAQTNPLDPTPTLSGYITRVSSPSDFDVNGVHVIVNGKTQLQRATDAQSSSTNVEDVFFGECTDIYGKLDRKQHRVEATKVVFCRFDSEALSGVAIIDHLIEPAIDKDLVVRADGYPIRIEPSTAVAYVAPLSSLNDIKPNIWIEYHGTLSSNGTILADKVLFRPNNISEKEGELRRKNEYDPSTVPPNSEQSAISKHFLGMDPKKIPPYDDPAMQSRVDRIGASLIPSYQRHLKSDEPSRISFRFQLIDNPKLNDALTLPNGIILVPRQIVERLENDSQLATVLADNIATALEKQRYRLDPAYKTTNLAMEMASVGGAFVPGLGLAGVIAKHVSDTSIKTDLIQQSGRVSLGLLRDAGYDLEQAPVAWWLLAAKPSKSMKDTQIPSRALNLYRAIGLIWTNYPTTASPANNAVTSSTN